MSQQKLKTVALLPMKANSERVPGKNFRLFAGKPLFRWILDTLLELDEIDKVVINTDARQTLIENGLVEGERILIRDRKPELCGDEVSMNRVLSDDVESVEAERYLMTHTTNPLLSGGTIRKMLESYIEGVEGSKNFDSLFTVNRYQTRFYRADGSPVNHNPERLVPTQDLEPWYEENSMLYLFSRDSFSKTGSRIGSKPMMYATPRMESVDIDVPTEWRLAEVLALSGQLFRAQTGSHIESSECGLVVEGG